jgi:K+ potassium transporter
VRRRGSISQPRLLPLTAMGIVYGDLGTSPLYTLRAVAEATSGTAPLIFNSSHPNKMRLRIALATASFFSSVRQDFFQSRM